MARKAKASPKNARSVTLDFSGIEERFRPPEDDYRLEIVKVAKSESSNNNDQLEIDFKILEGKYEDKTFRQWFSLVEQALWKLAGVLRSAGVELPDGPAELDFDDIEGLTLGATISHREYNDSIKVEITDSWEDEEEAEEPAKPAKKGAKEEPDEPKGKKAKKGKELPKLDGDEVSEMDEDELEDVIEKYTLDVDLSDFKTLRKKAAAVIDALESKDMLEEE